MMFNLDYRILKQILELSSRSLMKKAINEYPKNNMNITLITISMPAKILAAKSSLQELIFTK
jgi:hypothetical protein